MTNSVKTREEKIIDFVNNSEPLQLLKRQLLSPQNATSKRVVRNNAVVFNAYAIARYDFEVEKKLLPGMKKEYGFDENLEVLKHDYLSGLC